MDHAVALSGGQLLGVTGETPGCRSLSNADRNSAGTVTPPRISGLLEPKATESE